MKNNFSFFKEVDPRRKFPLAKSNFPNYENSEIEIEAYWFRYYILLPTTFPQQKEDDLKPIHTSGIIAGKK